MSTPVSRELARRMAVEGRGPVMILAGRGSGLAAAIALIAGAAAAQAARRPAPPKARTEKTRP
jgi:hypothetical protein